MTDDETHSLRMPEFIIRSKDFNFTVFADWHRSPVETYCSSGKVFLCAYERGGRLSRLQGVINSFRDGTFRDAWHPFYKEPMALHDHKGTLTVLWSDKVSDTIAKKVGDIWCGEMGENLVRHFYPRFICGFEMTVAMELWFEDER